GKRRHEGRDDARARVDGKRRQRASECDDIGAVEAAQDLVPRSNLGREPEIGVEAAPGARPTRAERLRRTVAAEEVRQREVGAWLAPLVVQAGFSRRPE